MIGYYVHHHGSGHLNRATSICAQLRHPAVALTSLDIPRHPFATVLRLPRDDGDPRPAEPSANGALHWVPHHDDGLRARLALIARWIDATRPAAIVVDVSVEVALFVRLLGVPVIVMAMPGDRTDAPHASVHQIADHIIAAWPRELYEPDWLRAYAAKTSYVGGISRFVGHQVLQPTTNRAPTVLFLSGTGGCDFDQSTVDATAGLLSEIRWTTLGLRGGPRTCDPWPDICAADVVITHAGQSCVADVATARRPAIVLPQARPFNEQHATAETLRRHRLAVTSDGWPDGRAWRRLIRQARGADPSSWERWRTTGAAARAAEAIDATARQYAGNVMRTAVITTVNGRTQHLRRQLVGLSCSARLPDAHVIVAIGDPAVPDVVAASGTTADVVHCEGLPGPLPVASARNIGALTALNDGAELLVFVDVDCIPGRNLLGRYHEAVVDPEHRDALLCGPVTYLPPPRGADGYPIALEPMINPHPARPAPPDGDTVSSTDYELFWSLSFALTASTWRRIGGFCDRYRGYGAEDTDFAQTARAASVPMRWVGGAHAFHQFHSVSDPPAEHLHDIVRNAMVFHQRWGWWPMSNWLDAFEQRPNRISKEHGPVEIWTLFAPSPGASQHQGYR